LNGFQISKLLEDLQNRGLLLDVIALTFPALMDGAGAGGAGAGGAGHS
jgi:uncharacterized protein (DUF934 family)